MPLEIQNVLIPVLLSMGLLASLWLSLTIKMETRKKESELDERVGDLEARLTRIDFERKSAPIPGTKGTGNSLPPRSTASEDQESAAPPFAYDVRIPRLIPMNRIEKKADGNSNPPAKDLAGKEPQRTNLLAEGALTKEQLEFLDSIRRAEAAEVKLIAG